MRITGVSFCSTPRRNILALLEGGDRRSIGRSEQVAAIASKNQALFPEWIRGWCSQDPLVRMRAADATEKVIRGVWPSEHERPVYFAERRDIRYAVCWCELEGNYLLLVPSRRPPF